jgi:phage-related protein
VFFREVDGSVPVLDWLDDLPSKVVAKCRVRIERLRALGYELRRPEADFLRDGIYELRVGFQGRHYRLLYFFHKDAAAILSHGLVKEKSVPPVEIRRAIARMSQFEANPVKHTYEEP